MAVPHDPAAAVLVDQARATHNEAFDLGLDRVRQHAPSAVAQHSQQRVVGNAPSWSGQPDNDILVHGVSFMVNLNITEDTPPSASATKSAHSSSFEGEADCRRAAVDAHLLIAGNSAENGCRASLRHNSSLGSLAREIGYPVPTARGILECFPLPSPHPPFGVFLDRPS